MARAVSSKEQAASGSGFLRLLVPLVLLGAAFLWFGRKASGPEEGTLAREFSLPVVAGARSQVALAELKGRPVLVEVVASWCGVCKRSAPTLRGAALARRKRDVEFLAVSVDEDESAARGLRAAWDIPYDVAHDRGAFAKAYGITLLPTLVLIDEFGKIRHVSSGAPRADDVEQWLAEVGAERM